MTRRPGPGDVVRIGAAASTQFGGDRAITMRVISVDGRPTYHGWLWLTGYVLDQAGRATARREVFVQLAGVRLVAGGERGVVSPAGGVRVAPPADGASATSVTGGRRNAVPAIVRKG